MNSVILKYFREMESLSCYEHKDEGFILYTLLDENKILYIHTIYVDPKHRRKSVGTEMGNALAKQMFHYYRSIEEIQSRVDKNLPGWQAAIKFQIDWGMEPVEWDESHIYFRKPVDEKERERVDDTYR